MRHYFAVQWQGERIREMKESLRVGEVLILVDYGANFCLYGIAGQGTVRNQAEYFLPAQVSILGIVCYYFSSDDVVVQQALTGEFHPVISDDLTHRYYTVHAALSKVLTCVQQRTQTVLQRCVIVSDGSTAQFKGLLSAVIAHQSLILYVYGILLLLTLLSPPPAFSKV